MGRESLFIRHMVDVIRRPRSRVDGSVEVTVPEETC